MLRCLVSPRQVLCKTKFFQAKCLIQNQNQIFLILSLIRYQLLPLFFSESKSESDDSESDFSSVFINLAFVFFLPYIYTLLNKLAHGFFYLFSKQNQ